MTPNSRIGRGVSWNYAALAIGVLLQSLQLLVVSRCLEPAEVGVMSMCLVVMGVVDAFAGAGVGPVIVREPVLTVSAYRACVLLGIGVGALSGAVVFVFAPAIAGVFHAPELALPLRTLSVTFLIVPLGLGPEMRLRRSLEFGAIARSQVVASTLSTAMVIGCALGGYGVMSLVWGYLANRATLCICLVSRRPRTPLADTAHRRHEVGSLLKFGLPQVAERVLNLAGERIDYALIGAFMGAESLGFYAFAMNLVTLPASRLNVAVTSVAFPVLSRLLRDRRRLGDGYLNVVRGLTSLNAPLMLGVAATAAVSVPTVFGERWSPAVAALQILTVVGLARSIFNPIGSLILATGAVRRSLVWNLLSTAVASLSLFLAASLHGGVSGVAATLAFVHVALFAPFFLVLVRPLAPIKWADYVRACLSPVVATLPAAGVAWVLALPFSPGMVLLIAQCAVFCGTYSACLVWFDPVSARFWTRFARSAAVRVSAAIRRTII